MLRNVRRFLGLRLEKKVLFLRAWCGLLVADAALRCLPFSRVDGLLDPGRRRERRPGSPVLEPEDLASLVGLAARHHLYPMSCLRQALVLRWLLVRAGFQARLQIGVRACDNALAAHAWVEADRRPVGELGRLAVQYLPLEHCVSVAETS